MVRRKKDSQAVKAWPVWVQGPRKLVNMRGYITGNAWVSIYEPRASERWVPVIQLQLKIGAVFLNVISIVDAIKTGTNVDYPDFAICYSIC